jgi:uncharacterized protein involved in exopolysaccharide biosynthesis
MTVILLVGLVSVMAPREYEITAHLLVNTARAEVPLAPGDASKLVISKLSDKDLNSEIQVLKSRQLIEDVLLALGVDDSWRPERGAVGKVKGFIRSNLGMAEGSYFNEMVVHLQNEIRITAVKRSNVIQVSYLAEDADRATQIVKALTERYLERRAEMYQSPQVVSFFEEQMLMAERRLAENEQALERSLAASGTTMVKGPLGSDSLAAQKMVVMGRLAEAKDELAGLEVEVQGKLHEVLILKARIAEEPERIPSAGGSTKDTAIISALAALELERDALLQDFKPDSRYVRDIDTQIELAELRLAQVEDDRASIDGTELNVLHQELKSLLVRAETEIEGNLARIDLLRGHIFEYSRALERVNESSFEVERIQRDAQASEEDYLLYRKKHEEARIASAMDKQQLINVTITQPARIPLRPVSRGLFLRMIIVTMFGFGGSLGLAFAREFYLDHSFTTGDEIERRLGIPHIASIPDSEVAG